MIFLLLLFHLTPFSADRVEIIKEDNESIVHLVGNVVFEDTVTRITCREAHLYESRNYVLLQGDVDISDKNGVIQSSSARYDFKERKGYLSGGVSLETKNDELIHSDSLYYDGVAGLIEFFGEIKLEDRKNDLIGYGNRGAYDLKNDEGYLLGEPRLEILREEKEPIKINAREFRLDSGDNLFQGIDSVVTIIDSITVYCDTMYYNLKEHSGRMVKPCVFEKKNELYGETGEFRMKSQKLDFFSVENGWSKYYTEEGTKNVVEGERIRILFKEDRASKIIVEGKPKGVLTLRAEEDAAD